MIQVVDDLGCQIPLSARSSTVGIAAAFGFGDVRCPYPTAACKVGGRA